MAVLHQRRQQRHHDRADEPEDADHHAGAPQAGVGPEVLQKAAGRAKDVDVDLQVRRGGARGGDEQRRKPAQAGEAHDENAQPGRIAAIAGADAAGDRAEQDGDEGRALDQRVACRDFIPFQVIGQDAVFDGSEQGREDAEQEQRNEQHRHRMKREAQHRDRGGAHFGELQALAPSWLCRTCRPTGRQGPRAGRRAG